MLSSVAIKDSKETLAANIVKVDDKRVRVLHCASGTLLSREAETKCGVVCGVAIQYLGNNDERYATQENDTYAIGVELCGRD